MKTNKENQKLSADIIGVTVTYDKPTTFYLKMIGVSEENKLRQKLFGLSDDEKAEKQFDLNVDTLAGLAEKPNNEPSENAIYTGESVREFFAEKTVITERIAEYALRGYLLKLQPDVSFL